MISLWVDRNGLNNIKGLHPVAQYDGQEKLTDEDQEVLDFLNPPIISLTPSERIDLITDGSDLNIVTFKMIFKLHNRLLIQEGLPVITVAEFLTFLEGELT